MSAKENRIELTKAVIDAAVCEQGKPFVYVMDTAVGGTHGVFLVFNSESDGVICKLDQLSFEK